VKRRILKGIAVLSALLCVATVALWVRSYWGGDYFSGTRYSYLSNHGHFTIFLDHGWQQRAWKFRHWPFVPLFAILPACWVLGPHHRCAKRRKLGLCPTCGYDLRATPDRCPECGTVSGGRA